MWPPFYFLCSLCVTLPVLQTSQSFCETLQHLCSLYPPLS
uniref:Uncharacterized protein n=1 Tax=Arundo donax TaxID=35708 RepID=A0A0A8YNI4_ARUDO